MGEDSCIIVAYPFIFTHTLKLFSQFVSSILKHSFFNHLLGYCSIGMYKSPSCLHVWEKAR